MPFPSATNSQLRTGADKGLIHALEPRLGSGNALEEGRFY